MGVVSGRIAEGDWEEAIETAPPGWLLLHASWAEIEPERGRFDAGVFERRRKLLHRARRRGVEPVVCLHRGALPDWQVARDGWLDPDALAAWSCYADKVAYAWGEQLRWWVSFWEPLEEADWYDAERGRVARCLLDAQAAAYLHLRRGPGPGGRPAQVGVVASWAAWREGGVRGRMEATLRARLGPEALAKVLFTGKLAPPFAPVGELPNGTPALDWLGVRWRGALRAGDQAPLGDEAADELQATLDRVWVHGRPLVLVGGPDGAADRARDRGVRVYARLTPLPSRMPAAAAG